MQIEGIDYAVFEVADLRKSLSFYRDILGLTLLGIYRERGWAEFDINGQILALRGPASASFYRDKLKEEKGYILEEDHWQADQKGKQTGASVALRVPDVADAVAELRAKGVTILQETFDSDVCHVAVFQDPDGNALYLHRRHDESYG